MSEEIKGAVTISNEPTDDQIAALKADFNAAMAEPPEMDAETKADFESMTAEEASCTGCECSAEHDDMEYRDMEQQEATPVVLRRIHIRGVEPVTSVQVGNDLVRGFDVPGSLRIAVVKSWDISLADIETIRETLTARGFSNAVILGMGHDDDFQLLEEVPAAQLTAEEARQLLDLVNTTDTSHFGTLPAKLQAIAKG